MPRILVIDDDAVDRMHSGRLLAEIFGPELRLEFATNWDEATAAVAANVHDIYIVDHFLGAGTGLEIIESAAQSDETRIFILLTGNENRDVDIAATRAGVADFIVKNDLTARRLERSLRYAGESMRQKRLLIEQADELRKTKAAIEEDAQKQQILTKDLTKAQSQLTDALTRAEKSERRYRWLAQHDLLTKIPNRALFTEKLCEGLGQASRSKKDLALLLLDIDRFKWINDSFGHQVGDGFLVQVAQRLTDILRETDIIARVGGDEFAIIATNLDDENSAATVAEKVVAALSEPFDVSGHHIETGASVGIAMLERRQGREADAMILEADSALYRAKAAGRGVFHFYDDALDDEIQRSLLLKRELPRAIKAGDFSLVFQPKIKLSNGAISGVEALARWPHATLQAISPGEFIPLAESTGQIVPLSEWIFEEALQTLASWRNTPLDGVSMAVNLSALLLKRNDLVDEVRWLLDRHSLDPALLELEITETAALENLDIAICQLNKLRELGVTIAIDDFGTGYSSLALATSLPADCLKIDLSFVAGMLNNGANAAAVNSTITLAHSLGIRTVAEGVETEEQLTYLQRQGCDEAQGYFFAKPLPKDEILDWHGTHAGRLLPAA
ncbi:EAL domain-containing protein [Pelagibius litoralis]|uniref:EAL domain-containing protein n=1 Tax=Pelagibius litoralis TaxID=374515 RepID=A0A967KEE8_9PROT|nr:EAL domain-containing protein [Pelagibius litoralis]NIA70695.1 EAL domain-containing protein [Pelagibius litoralis]